MPLIDRTAAGNLPWCMFVAFWEFSLCVVTDRGSKAKVTLPKSSHCELGRFRVDTSLFSKSTAVHRLPSERKPINLCLAFLTARDILALEVLRSSVGASPILQQLLHWLIHSVSLYLQIFYFSYMFLRIRYGS